MTYARHQDVLIELFARLEADDVPFVFLRNHQAYPETVSGDVDCLVPKSELHKIVKLARAINCPTAILRQIIRKADDLYLMFYIPEDIARPFLVFEFFTGMVRKGQPVVTFERVNRYRTPAAFGHGLQRGAELSYAVVHYALFKGSIPEKYYLPLRDELTHEDFVAIANSMLGKQVLSSNDQTPAQIIEAVRKRYRETFSMVQFLRYLLGNLFWARPTMIGARVFTHPNSASAMLKYAERYHLFRPGFRFVLRDRLVHRHLTSHLVAWLGGLALIADARCPNKPLDGSTLGSTATHKTLIK